MITNTIRKALGRKKYLAMAISLIITAQAQGVEFKVGQIEASVDSQISMGSSWRVESQDPRLLSTIKGESSNGDDGNKNYKNGDAFSQIFKGSHELQFSYQNVGGFVRGKYWYDSALANNSVEYGHTPTVPNNGVPGAPLDYTNASTRLDDSNFDDLSKAQGVALLDAFVYAEFDVLDMPLDVRLGKQVVNWGESTFLIGGVNAINPLDVSAFKRPGAEIKEVLLPVNMAYANIGLSENLSAEAFYQLKFQETVVPGCGTYFSTSDVVSPGCNSITIADGVASVARAADGIQLAKTDGQYGLALRYISPALGNTEFGLYAMNIHSRMPVSNINKHLIDETKKAFILANYGPIALMQQYATTGSYVVTYPEDIQIAGLSFANNVGSVALSGEISHTKDLPIQLNGGSLVSLLLVGASNSPQWNAEYNATDLGGVVEGFRRFDTSQAQVSAIKFFDQVAGASRMTLIAEAGYTYIHDFDEGPSAMKYGRSAIFGTPGAADNEDDGFVTESSWGYRARVVADYADVFAGINLKPMLAWSEDVKGYAPQPGGNFVEGQKSLGLSVVASYLHTYSASISYTQYTGGDYSVINDRDFASISVGMQF